MSINWSPLPPPGQSIFGFDADTIETFDRAFISSLDPRVAALHTGEVGMLDAAGQPTTALDPSTRFNLAYTLAKEGLFIDTWIDAYGSDPYLTNYNRIQEGILTITSAIGTATRPVSINPADYPPFSPPAPAPQVMVGPLEFGTLYQLTSTASGLYVGGQLKAGQPLTENGHTYVLLVVNTLSGPAVFWELTA